MLVIWKCHFADFINSRGSHLQTQVHVEEGTGEIAVIPSLVSVAQVCSIVKRVRASEMHRLSVDLITCVILYESKYVHRKKKRSAPKIQIRVCI